MADFAMCNNDKCSLRSHCYRYRAKPSLYQSYGEFQPFRDECDHYWDFSEYTKGSVRTMEEIEGKGFWPDDY